MKFSPESKHQLTSWYTFHLAILKLLQLYFISRYMGQIVAVGRNCQIPTEPQKKDKK